MAFSGGNIATSLATTTLATLATITLLTACDSQKSSTATTAEQEPLVSGIRMDYIDTSVAPGQDFFEYANGQWLKNTEIPADKSRYGAFDMLRDKARDDVQTVVQSAAKHPDAKTPGTEAQQIADFYASFMAEEQVEQRGIQPLTEALASIDNIENVEQLAAYFARAGRQNIDTPLGFYIDTDEKQPNQYIVYFGQSGLGLPDRDYYLTEEEKFVTIQNQYRTHIQTILNLAGIKADETTANAIYAIEHELASYQWPREDLRDRDRTYNKYAQAELGGLSPGFDWPAYLSDAGIDASPSVIVSAPSYFEQLGTVLNNFSLEDWQAYLRWHTVSRYAPYLNQALVQEDFNFYGTVLSGTTEQEERWKRAINTLNSQLGDAIGKLYVEQYFPPQAKQRMVELVENLREAYRESILGLEWMGEETKQRAIEKLHKFTPKIGYPDQWKDFSALQIKADDLFGNVARATEFHYQYEINKLGKPVDRGEWFMSPQTVNAYYNPGMNEIVFPAAILQPPFFNLEADDAINYGAIGGVIGHEMGHGFDDQGAKSDGDGLLENWWTEQDLAEFQQRTGKLVDQYDAFTVLDDVHINGSLTLGENIGDLGGLTIAYKAYELSLKGQEAPVLDGFTGLQRLFLGWAQVWASKSRDAALQRQVLTDPHSPPRFRTNGVVRNMSEFHSAFDVKAGDPMYLPPADQVKIW